MVYLRRRIVDCIRILQDECQGITPSNSKVGLPAPEARARAHKRERLQAEQAQPAIREARETKQRVERRARPGGPPEKEAERGVTPCHSRKISNYTEARTTT